MVVSKAILNTCEISRISFNDFVSNFDSLEICFLGPESMGEIEVQEGIRKWKSCLFEGGWQRGVNAGGCRNYTCKLRFHVRIVRGADC